MHTIESNNRRVSFFKSAGLFMVYAALLWFAGAAGTAHGQIITASLEGTIQDGTGSVIPNARVAVVNTSTGVVSHAASDASGRFVVASLAPGGPYQVTVEADGFKNLSTN